ncbi:MAG: tRNA (cytidine(34)-2'-O)-methyltransferase [Burkholderiales bacterium]
MFEVVLYEPEIPPNSGNAIRLCANSGSRLHLVRPLGFSLRDRQLRRAGLDYHELAAVRVHADWEACRDFFGGRRMYAVTTQGAQRHDVPRYRAGDVFVFGSETRGLPSEVLDTFATAQRIRVPMRERNRSLNLANTVAIVVYEAWRQLGFPGGV